MSPLDPFKDDSKWSQNFSMAHAFYEGASALSAISMKDRLLWESTDETLDSLQALTALEPLCNADKNDP